MKQNGHLPLSGLLIALLGFFLLGLSPGASGQAQSVTSATVAFSYSPQHPDINTPVTLDASGSQSPNGAIVSYQWDFNGDGQFDLTTSQPTVTHLFDRSGDLPVALKITDTVGQSFTSTETVSVASAPVLVRRSVSTPVAPNRVAAGNSFQVTVTIQSTVMINGSGLEEDPPQGWIGGVVDDDGGRAICKSLQCVFMSALNPGEVHKIVYDVTVPAGATAGLYNLDGWVTHYGGHGLEFKIEVVGDNIVQVF